jgi:hypothetical protein
MWRSPFVRIPRSDRHQWSDSLQDHHAAFSWQRGRFAFPKHWRSLKPICAMRRVLPLVLVLVVSAIVWRIWGRFRAEDVITYRGEQIKLSRAYRDFDAYKNDPRNIHPSETARVQRLLINAPIEHSFGDRLALFRAVGQIAFPGYGVGSGGGRSADGDELLAVAIEIPRATKDRYLVFRDRDGRYDLIDDFVNAEISYPFEIRERDSAYVYLQGGTERFRRPRR